MASTLFEPKEYLDAKQNSYFSESRIKVKRTKTKKKPIISASEVVINSLLIGASITGGFHTITATINPHNEQFVEYNKFVTDFNYSGISMNGDIKSTEARSMNKHDRHVDVELIDFTTFTEPVKEISGRLEYIGQLELPALVLDEEMLFEEFENPIEFHNELKASIENRGELELPPLV